jgi:hypothetical protein
MIINSYRYAGGAPAAWTPSDLTTLAAWYDATDASTITEVATQVSQWDDKSGNANHATQSVGAEQPNYDAINQQVDFTGFENFDVNIPLSYAAGFLVAYIFDDVTSTTFVRYVLGGNQTGMAAGGTGSGSLRMLTLYNGPFITQGDANVDVLDIGIHTRDKLYKNGTELGYLSNNVGTDATILTIGNRTDFQGSGLYAGLKELIICDSTTSQSDREKIEGYLAHKYGQTSKLPALHPYKTTAP